ncbi:MAG: hypothetical protein QXE31_04460 [Candidatus Woesearchaeota archaeon]
MKNEQKKGALVISEVIGAILVIAVFLILFITTGLYKIILGESGKDLMCEGSFIASALTRPFLNYGNSVIDPNCAVNKITVVNNKKDNIENQYVLQQDYRSTILAQSLDTYERVKNWNKNQEIPEETKFSYFEDYSREIFSNGEKITLDNPTIEQKEYVRGRYNLDRLFAEEMKRCWNIVGQGELPLFDNWFTFVDCDKNQNGIQNCENIEKWISAIKNGKIKPTATFCVLCARIKFDDEINNKFSGVDNGYYSSVARWMGNHPIRNDKKESYYDYVYNTDKMSSFAEMFFPKYRTDRAYAVVFMRINDHGGINFFKTLAGLNKYKNSDVYYANIIKLIPYEDISKECDYLVASEV